MNIFSRTTFIILYTFSMNVFAMNESFPLGKNQVTIEMCTFQQVAQGQLHQSVFIEEVTTNPVVLHISEPMRLSVKANMSESVSTKFVGNWMIMYVLHDFSVCFVPDHEKTKTMNDRSEYLHQNLQTRMHSKFR